MTKTINWHKEQELKQKKIFLRYCQFSKYSLGRLQNEDLISKSHNNYVPNSTCIPFDVKLFISNEGKIFPCEKVSYSYALGDIYYNDIIDSKNISKNYKALSDKVISKCNNCYNTNCGKCMFTLELDKDKVICDSFISKKSFTNLIKKQFSLFSDT